MNLFIFSMTIMALVLVTNGKCPNLLGTPLTVGLAWYEHVFLRKSYISSIIQTASNTMKVNDLNICEKYRLKVDSNAISLRRTKREDWNNSSVLAYFLTTRNDFRAVDVQKTKEFLDFTIRNGIPTIAWTPDIPNLANSDKYVNISPSMEDQAKAISSILKEYNWSKFSIFTAVRSGTDEFLQKMKQTADESDYEILSTIKLSVLNDSTIRDELFKIKESNAKIIVLNVDYVQADIVFKHATQLSLTGDGFAWILTKSALGNTHGDNMYILADYQRYYHRIPNGTIGITFDTSSNGNRKALELATEIYILGMDTIVNKPGFKLSDVEPGWSLNSVADNGLDSIFNVQNPKTGEPFFKDRALQNVNFEIMTLTGKQWKKVGDWSKQDGLGRVVGINPHVFSTSSSDRVILSKITVVLVLCVFMHRLSHL